MDASSQSPPPAAGTFAGERARAFAFLARRERFHPAEALPWLLAIAAFFLFPNQMTLGSQTLIMVLFALSLDLILGYAGIVTLGHAAYFGVGAYAAALLITGVGWTEPISGLVCATIVAAIAGLFSGLVLLRYRGLALLVLTLSTTIMLQQLGNLFRDFTGGYDGIPGINIAPLFGYFDYDLYGHTYYLYCLGVLLVVFLGRAPDRQFAVRSGAGRHPRECRTHARARLAGALASGHGLYDLRGPCRHRRRAVRADQHAGDARRVRFRPVGRGADDAHSRRRRMALWRVRRRRRSTWCSKTNWQNSARRSGSSASD